MSSEGVSPKPRSHTDGPSLEKLSRSQLFPSPCCLLPPGGRSCCWFENMLKFLIRKVCRPGYDWDGPSVPPRRPDMSEPPVAPAPEGDGRSWGPWDHGLCRAPGLPGAAFPLPWAASAGLPRTTAQPLGWQRPISCGKHPPRVTNTIGPCRQGQSHNVLFSNALSRCSQAFRTEKKDLCPPPALVQGGGHQQSSSGKHLGLFCPAQPVPLAEPGWRCRHCRVSCQRWHGCVCRVGPRRAGQGGSSMGEVAHPAEDTEGWLLAGLRDPAWAQVTLTLGTAPHGTSAVGMETGGCQDERRGTGIPRERAEVWSRWDGAGRSTGRCSGEQGWRGAGGRC